MAKKLIKKFLPDPYKITENKYLRFLGTTLHHPNLWYLNRRSVAMASFVGIVCAFIPMPFQMVLASIVAVLVRCNIALSIALVWITNPLTMPVIFYFTYSIGCYLLNTPVLDNTFQDYFNIDNLGHNFVHIAKPLFVGSILFGFILGSISYLIIRISWRLNIINNWKKRKKYKIHKK